VGNGSADGEEIEDGDGSFFIISSILIPEEEG
jgi:hypothetical protein